MKLKPRNNQATITTHIEMNEIVRQVGWSLLGVGAGMSLLMGLFISYEGLVRALDWTWNGRSWNRVKRIALFSSGIVTVYGIERIFGGGVIGNCIIIIGAIPVFGIAIIIMGAGLIIYPISWLYRTINRIMPKN